MKINIHTPSGLIPISPEVTKQTIIDALGYNPADQAAYDSIDATDNTTFYIIDSQQHILAKVDADGLHAAIMTVNGKDVESGLIYDIKELDDSAFYIVDKDQNVICRIDENGLITTQIAADIINTAIINTSVINTDNIQSENSDFYISDKNNNPIFKVGSNGIETTNIISSSVIANDAILSEYSVVDHIEDNNQHVTIVEKTRWNEKIDSSKLNSELSKKVNLTQFNTHIYDNDIHLGDEIKVDDNSALYINDNEGKVIAQFGETGVIVGQLTANNIVLQDELLSDTLTDLSNDITTAKNEAITIAANDATTKANTAKADAKSHADSLNSAMDIRVKANTEAIKTLNGTEEGSVDFKINAAFNDFATKVSNDEVVNTYKELIDYASAHGAEFTTLVGEVSKKAETEVLNNHMSDDTRHIGDEIKLEDNSTLYIVDKEEKIIAQFDGSGLTVKDLTATNINLEEESLSNKLNNLSTAITNEATTRETSDNNL